MIVYNPNNTPSDVQSMLETLAGSFPIVAGESPNVVFQKIKAAEPTLRVSKQRGIHTVEYSEPRCAGRGIGSVLAGLSGTESSPLKTLGIMLDCSRNKVMTVDKVKTWLDQLCLAGYNLVMLYTEDTYELKKYPFFGFMRGGYTLAELREMDDYAASLGIELVGCIQTLGHLEQILRWNEFSNVHDTARVLLVENDKTYELIEAMIDFWSKALRSRRINIGLDETHDLGRGRYMDMHGYKDATILFNEHLQKVNAICNRSGLSVIMWSDMFFRLANPNRDYYDLSRPIPAAVKKTIPTNVQLGYWDYYHEDKKTYLDMIAAHRALGFEPLMVSGVWTWSKAWCDMDRTERTAKPCVEACRTAKLDELIFTMWGDDGAYCIFDSAMPGLYRMADLAYGQENLNSAKKRFEAVRGIPYDLYCTPAELEKPLDMPDGTKFPAPPAVDFVWDDPLLAILTFFYSATTNPLLVIRKRYATLLRKIRAAERKTGDFDLAVMAALTDAALSKIDLRLKLEKAYAAQDIRALKRIAGHDVPETVAKIECWNELFRANWRASAKPFGLDVIQHRTGGVLARLNELQLSIYEYCSGDATALAELDAPKPKLNEPCLLTWYREFAESSRQG